MLTDDGRGEKEERARGKRGARRKKVNATISQTHQLEQTAADNLSQQSERLIFALHPQALHKPNKASATKRAPDICSYESGLDVSWDCLMWAGIDPVPLQGEKVLTNIALGGATSDTHRAS